MALKIRMNVASRLNMTFAALGLLIIILVAIAILAMNRISHGVDQVVGGAAPAQKAVSELQIELLEISRLAIEHYNAIDIETLDDFEQRYSRTLASFEETTLRLDERLSRIPDLGESRENVGVVAERSQSLFEQVSNNMRVYRDSLVSQQNINQIRLTLTELRNDVEPVFAEFLADTTDAQARSLVYEVRNIVTQGFFLANELALVRDLSDFQQAQDGFRSFMDEYGALGFRMLGLSRQNPDFQTHQQKVGDLVSALIEQVSANDGLLPIQNNYLQIRASLQRGVLNTQAGLMDEVQALDQVANRIDQAAVGIGQQATAQVGQSRTLIITVALFAIAVGVLFSYWVVRSIRRPLKRLRTYMASVGEGEFAEAYGPHSHDELGDISQGMEQLVQRLSEMMGGIQQQNSTLNQVASDTSRLSANTLQLVEQQSTELDQVVTAINQMASSIREVASNAEVASKEMHNSEQDAQAIGHTIETTLNAVVTLESNMTEAVSVIQQLDEGVGSIQGILQTIQAIAEQTNLLALNAAIEAARAGEQGRGFAVVADEVRTLASRTQDSTEEIRQKIDWMLAQSAKAVSVMETSQSSTKAVSEQANEAQQRFTKFIEAISRLNELNLLIATASEQQSATTEEINRNVTAIRTVSEQTAEGAQEVSNQTQQVKKVADDLSQAVGQFHLQN